MNVPPSSSPPSSASSASQSSVIPPPPPSRRTPPSDGAFFNDLLIDLTVRVEWLEQVVAGVPQSQASEQLKGWSKALSDLRTSIAHTQAHREEPRFKQLFALDGPLAAFLSRLYAWCEEISEDFEALAVKLRRGEPVLALFAQKSVNASFAEFQELSDALRASLAISRPMTAEARAAWATFDSDFEELLWATEWLHLSLASKPGS
jgi:hypothetical protein